MKEAVRRLVLGGTEEHDDLAVRVLMVTAEEFLEYDFAGESGCASQEDGGGTFWPHCEGRWARELRW